MTDNEAVAAIRTIWARWAMNELTDVEAWGGVTGVMATTGEPYPEGGWPANDDDGR